MISVTYPVMITAVVWSLHEDRIFIDDHVMAAALFALNSQNF